MVLSKREQKIIDSIGERITYFFTQENAIYNGILKRVETVEDDIKDHTKILTALQTNEKWFRNIAIATLLTFIAAIIPYLVEFYKKIFSNV